MTVAEILEGIRRLRVLIAADICLDRWCTYDPQSNEPSRETGIPRIGVIATEVTPGGGGTVANNAIALGAAQVAVLGVVGDDGNGHELTRALAARGIQASYLIRSASVPTFTYTKLINSETGMEDRPRVDFIQSEPLPPDIESQLIESLSTLHAEFDVLIALDQSENPGVGVLTPRLRTLVSKIAHDHPEKTVWADSRTRCETLRGVTVKVNRQEADEACARAIGKRDYAALREYMNAPRLFVTDGPEGVHIASAASLSHVPARKIAKPVDICGAGDSFSAAASCALALGATDDDAALFGNLVASITIMKRGTGTASPKEILAGHR